MLTVQEKKSKFTENNTVLLTLREELELVYHEHKQLEESISNLKTMLNKPDLKEWAELNNNMEKLKVDLKLKQQEIEENERIKKNLENANQKTK